MLTRASFLRRAALSFLGLFAAVSVVPSKPLLPASIEDAGLESCIDWRQGFVSPIL